MRNVAVLFLMCAAQLVGQIESDSITVTVSKNLNVPPEQVTLSIEVSSDTTATLDDVQAFLRSAGITGATFRSISGGVSPVLLGTGAVLPTVPTLLLTPPIPTLRWGFEFTVPTNKLQATEAALNKLAQPPTTGKRLSATYSAISSFASDATIADARRKALADLIAAAQQEATTIAGAAGFSVGPILAFREGPGDLLLTVKFTLLRFNSAQ